MTLTLVAATACALAARSLWICDLAVHFRVQYAALGLVGFILLLVVRAPAWALLALVLAASNAMYAAPALVSRPVADAPRGAAQGEEEPVRVRVASLNVLYANGDYTRVAEFIRRERPDALALMEMTGEWRKALGPLQKAYPHRFQTVGSAGRGVTFWSRYPLRDARVLPIGVKVEPAIEATLLLPGRELKVFSVHTTWPMAPGSARRRNEQLVQLADVARHVAMPLVVVGDFNISAFSPHFEQLLSDGHLRSAARGFGWQPTWPTFMPPAGIQIDHVLVNSLVHVEHFTRGESVGSDHLPVVADLVL